MDVFPDSDTLGMSGGDQGTDRGIGGRSFFAILGKKTCNDNGGICRTNHEPNHSVAMCTQYDIDS